MRVRAAPFDLACPMAFLTSSHCVQPRSLCRLAVLGPQHLSADGLAFEEELLGLFVPAMPLVQCRYVVLSVTRVTRVMAGDLSDNLDLDFQGLLIEL